VLFHEITKIARKNIDIKKYIKKKEGELELYQNWKEKLENIEL